MGMPGGRQRMELLCGHCRSVLARRNTQGLMYCEDCGDYRNFFEEPLHAPAPSDEPNHGYVFGDVVCTGCYSIIVTVREAAQRIGK